MTAGRSKSHVLGSFVVALAAIACGRVIAQDAPPPVAPEPGLEDDVAGAQKAADLALGPVFTETLEAPGVGAPSGQDLLRRAVDAMGGDAWGASTALDVRLKHYRWFQKRLQNLIPFDMKLRLGDPLQIRLVHKELDERTMRRVNGKVFVVNGDDAFMLSGIDVLSAELNEKKADRLARLQAFQLLAPVIVLRAGSPVVFEGRCTVEGHAPARYVAPAADSEADVGYLDYQPVTRHLLQVRAEVPEAYRAAVGEQALFWFDETDGSLARMRFQMLGRDDEYWNLPMTFEVESWTDLQAGAKHVRIPALLHVLSEDHSERVETIRVLDPKLDPTLDDALFKRP